MRLKVSFIDNMIRAIFLFVFFSLVGWIYEVGLAFLYGDGFVNRGFLFGPYLPIYGFGALILILTLQGVMKNPRYCWKLNITPLLVFVLIMVIATAIEYAASYILEMIFDQRWWDYSSYRIQLHGRICLSASVRFGIGGLFFLYVLTPLFDKIIDWMSVRTRQIFAIIIIALLLIDLIFVLQSLA